ncbi:MAG: hypothetical protein RBR35_15235 [Salinivirgaceae bacterium]|nr:hypothetical protein [Salinivirgaceae bacterium]
MKKVFFGIVLSSFLLFFNSCSNTEEAVAEYCNCMNTILNDSLIEASNIEELKKECYDSLIINKFELGDNTDFIANFDSIQEVKDVVVKRNSTIIKNVDKILQTFYFDTSPDIISMNNWTAYYRRYIFDGKMFKQYYYEKPYGGSYGIADKWTGTYKIEVEPNGKAYITITFENRENDIYELKKSTKDGYYLDGRRRLWQENK